MSEKEIVVSGKGLSLKGDVVDDVRPVVQRAAKTADSVLRLVANLVSLPCDFFSNNLENFRRKYSERFDEIPVERRQDPPPRIGYAVLRGVAYAADEPDIQELFANLLASASDTAMVKEVHPGFATVVSELRASDAKVLEYFGANSHRQVPIWGATFGDVDTEAFEQAIANLTRLGIFGWKERAFEERELARFVGKASYGSFIRPEQINRLLIDLVNDVQRFKNEVIKQLRMQHHRQVLELTSFGASFIETVVRKKATTSTRHATL